MHCGAMLNRKATSGRPVSSSVVREKVIRLLRTEFDFISNKSFSTIDRVFERDVLERRFEVAVSNSQLPRNLPAHLARLCEAKVLTPEQEQDLFRRMNYLKYRANALRSRLDPHAPDAELLFKVEQFLAVAQTIRDAIIDVLPLLGSVGPSEIEQGLRFFRAHHV